MMRLNCPPKNYPQDTIFATSLMGFCARILKKNSSAIARIDFPIEPQVWCSHMHPQQPRVSLHDQGPRQSRKVTRTTPNTPAVNAAGKQ